MSDDAEPAEAPATIRSGSIGIYDPACFRFGAEALETLRHETMSQPLQCRTLFPLFPATSYKRQTPILIDGRDAPFAAHIAEFYQELASSPAAAATVVLQITEAVIAAFVVHVPSPDGYDILYESLRLEDQGDHTLPTTAVLDAAHDDFLGTDRAYLFICGRGWFNYGHWLVDDVPRAAAVRAIHEHTGKPVTVLVQSHQLGIDAVREDALLAMLPPEVPCEIVFLDPDLCYRVRELVFVTPVSAHPIWKSPEALRAMAETIRARVVGPPGPERIFVPRRRIHGRALVNQEEVERILQAHGFVTLDPEAMNFEAQVAAFAGARVVIGGMGAAMCNTVFCAPGARVIYLCPVGWREPFYWDLAAARGHTYAVCYGRAVDPEIEPYSSSYEITPRQVEKILRFVADAG